MVYVVSIQCYFDMCDKYYNLKLIIVHKLLYNILKYEC